MIAVLLLALASATSAACSTVAKHVSAGRALPTSGPASRLPPLLAGMIGSPWWLAGLVFDVGAVLLQVLALRFGDLSVVQPVLTTSLVIALGLSHVVEGTRMRKTEAAWGGCLLAGLGLFLASSGSLGPQGEEAIGRKAQAILLSVLALLVGAGCAWLARRTTGRHRARALAVVVALAYVAMAGFIKSSTRIVELRGWGAVLLSWQLWCLVGCAVLAMVLQQVAYAAAPLTQSQPVVASLDPLFALVLGVVVYGESLRHGPLDLALELPGLAMLLAGVMGLSRLSAATEEAQPDALTPDEGHALS